VIDIKLIKVSNVADLVRSACQFSGSMGVLYSKESGNVHRLMVLGEKVGKLRLTYYQDYEKAPNYVVYSANDHESFSFVDSIGQDTGYQTYKIQVLHIKNDAFSTPKSEKYNVSVVELTNYEEIVKGIASSAASSETIGTVYAFPHNGSTHIGAFGFFPDDDSLTFTHAEIPEFEGNFCFFRYDYNTGSITKTNGIKDTTSLYTRIINLAEPYSFLEKQTKQKNGTNK